jgi:hypothetical protein
MIQLTVEKIEELIGMKSTQYGFFQVVDFIKFARAVESAIKKKILDSELYPDGDTDAFADGYMQCVEDLKKLLMEEK